MRDCGVAANRDKARTLQLRMLRKLLALPLLLAEHIQPAFTAISSAGVPDAAAVDQQYCKLSYVSATWLESTDGQQTCLYTASTYAPTTSLFVGELVCRRVVHKPKNFTACNIFAEHAVNFTFYFKSNFVH